jgi:hypothetical protein
MFQSEGLLVGDNVLSVITSANLSFTMERVVQVVAEVVNISFNDFFGKNDKFKTLLAFYFLFFFSPFWSFFVFIVQLVPIIDIDLCIVGSCCHPWRRLIHSPKLLQ